MRWRVESARPAIPTRPVWFAFVDQPEPHDLDRAFDTWPEALQYALSMATSEACS